MLETIPDRLQLLDALLEIWHEVIIFNFQQAHAFLLVATQPASTIVPSSHIVATILHLFVRVVFSRYLTQEELLANPAEVQHVIHGIV